MVYVAIQTHLIPNFFPNLNEVTITSYLKKISSYNRIPTAWLSPRFSIFTIFPDVPFATFHSKVFLGLFLSLVTSYISF